MACGAFVRTPRSATALMAYSIGIAVEAPVHHEEAYLAKCLFAIDAAAARSTANVENVVV
jgi:hypothetical protein